GGPHEDATVRHLVRREPDRVADPEARVAHGQDERLDAGLVAAVLVASRDDSLHLVARERQCRRVFDLRRLHGLGRILLRPAGLKAEPKKCPQALEVLRGVERAVAPGLVELAKGVDRDMPDVPEPLLLGPGDEPIFREMTVLPPALPANMPG